MRLCVLVFWQHYLYELVIKTLVQHNLFYMLHQFLQYHVLSDSKPLVSSHLKLLQNQMTLDSGFKLVLTLLTRIRRVHPESDAQSSSPPS